MVQEQNEIILHLTKEEVFEAHLAIDCTIDEVQGDIKGYDLEETKKAIKYLKLVNTLLAYSIDAEKIQKAHDDIKMYLTMCYKIKSLEIQDVRSIKRIAKQVIFLKKMLEEVENIHKQGRKIHGIESLSDQKEMIEMSEKMLTEIYDRDVYKRYKKLTHKELNRILYKQIQEKRKDTQTGVSGINNNEKVETYDKCKW